MKTYKLSEMSRAETRELCRRNPVRDPELIETCQSIFREVAERGDEAVRELTEKYDGVNLKDFRADAREFKQALEEQPPEVLDAMNVAMRNIRKFHASQQLAEKPVEVQPGVQCWRAARAISSVGLYVPGGRAVLPSTVLMLGLPAKLAGCSKILLCVPPRPDGTVASTVLAAAQLTGIRQVFKIGGAQAIAAMALGTDSVPRVDKILGPGSRIVQTAKLVSTFYGAAIDMVAGPSELLVIADAEAEPDVVAADLLSQAEHGEDSQVVLVTSSADLIEAVEAQLRKQLEDLPRSGLASRALEQSFAVLVDSLEEAFDFSNRYAPEHLVLNLRDAREHLPRVNSAGSVFVGSWTPEVAGDYASGTNHTLPTAGMARNVSGVSLDSFVKKITFQELTPDGLQGLSATLKTLAEIEELQGHSRAVSVRLEKLEDKE